MTIQIRSDVHFAFALRLEPIDPISRMISSSQNQGMLFNAYDLSRYQIRFFIQWRDILDLSLQTVNNHVANWEWPQAAYFVINPVSWQAIVNAFLLTGDIR